jgi:pimeloyl-ACP methyl ester carboxylesterase
MGLLRSGAAMALGVLVLGACSAQTDGTASASEEAQVRVPGAGDALVSGNGAYGVIVLHGSDESSSSWAPVARQIASDRMTVAVPQTTTPDALRSAIGWLRTQRGTSRVAVIAAGDAGRSVQALGATDPTLVDQAILISPPAGLDWSAEFPKLFLASRDGAGAAAAREAADQAAGTWNVLLVVDGSASGQAIFSSPAGDEALKAVLRRLDDRR